MKKSRLKIAKFRRYKILLQRAYCISLSKIKRYKTSNDIHVLFKNCKIKDFVFEYQIDNTFYGIASTLKKYAGYNNSIAATIEHGVYLGSLETLEVNKYDLPCVITFGEYRKQILQKYNTKPIFTIGPYILYTQKNRNIAKLKQLYGKTLLVFPVHSIEWTKINYNINAFINYINKIKQQKQFDTIFVCLYFSDVSRFSKIYTDAGFKVVYCGHRTNTSFLHRQRLLIDLADNILTNGVGTHIGYSVALGKPVSLYNQIIQEDYSLNKKASFSKNDATAINNNNLIRDCFDGWHDVVTSKQIETVDYFWGTSHFKTPEQLYKIFVDAEKVHILSDTSQESYEDLYNNIIN